MLCPGESAEKGALPRPGNLPSRTPRPKPRPAGPGRGEARGCPATCRLQALGARLRWRRGAARGKSPAYDTPRPPPATSRTQALPGPGAGGAGLRPLGREAGLDAGPPEGDPGVAAAFVLVLGGLGERPRAPRALPHPKPRGCPWLANPRGCRAARSGPWRRGKWLPGKGTASAAAAEGRSPSFPRELLVVLCCQPWFFVPSASHLPYNHLTVSGTHSSGHAAPPLAKNTRPKKLLSLHRMRDGEETFPRQYWAFSGISVWVWSISGSDPVSWFLLPADCSLGGHAVCSSWAGQQGFC